MEPGVIAIPALAVGAQFSLTRFLMYALIRHTGTLISTIVAKIVVL